MSVCGKNVCRLQERCIHQARNMRLHVQAPAEESLQDSSEAPTRPEEFLRYEHTTPGPEMQRRCLGCMSMGSSFIWPHSQGALSQLRQNIHSKTTKRRPYPKVHF